MNDDLISRSALRKDIERLYSVYKDNKDYFYTDVLDHIDNAPTVERPQGEWIMNKTSARGRNYTCTNCRKVSRNKSEFCPKCGADMRGDGE